MHCIFCRIATKALATDFIYEDAEIMAFHDIRPIAPVHFLIVPKMHVPTLAECDASHGALLGRILLLAPELAKKLHCGYEVFAGHPRGGFKIHCHTGPQGQQEIYHLHFHVLGTPHRTKEKNHGDI